MEISKTLLSAIAAGILITSTSSCDKVTYEESHLSTCDENCTIEHELLKYDNCPGCGMG